MSGESVQRPLPDITIPEWPASRLVAATLLVVSIVLLFAGAYFFRSVLVCLMIGIVIDAALSPLINRTAALGVPRPTAVTAMCGVRVYPETPLAQTLLARGEVPDVEALYEPRFYFAPAVREGLSEVVASAARERGNWLLPGQKVNDEDELLGKLRGRGLKGDMWRYVSKLRMGAAIASR